MTLPGKMLTESVTRLGDVIAASKKVSDGLKAATVPVAAQPIPTQEAASEPSDRTGEQTA